MNSRSELFGGCRHKTKFHRLMRNNNDSSTDGGFNPERVSPTNKVTNKKHGITGNLAKAVANVCHAVGGAWVDI